MANCCLITGKKKTFGNNVSNSNRKTRRSFGANLRKFRLYSTSLGQFIHIRRISSAGIRTIEKNGGIDAFLLNTSDSKLTSDLRNLKKTIMLTLSAE